PTLFRSGASSARPWARRRARSSSRPTSWNRSARAPDAPPVRLGDGFAHTYTLRGRRREVWENRTRGVRRTAEHRPQAAQGSHRPFAVDRRNGVADAHPPGPPARARGRAIRFDRTAVARSSHLV